MARKRNVIHLRIAYINQHSRSAMDKELRLLNDLNQILALNQRFHKHGHTAVIPTITKHTAEEYGCVIQLQFHIDPNGDESGAYSYSGLHAMLVALSHTYATHKQAFPRLEFKIDLSNLKTPWVIRNGNNSALVHPLAVTKVYQDNESPMHLVSTFTHHHRQCKIEEMLIVGEPQVVARFDRLWKRYISASPRRVLYMDQIPKSKAQVFIRIQHPNGSCEVLPVNHESDKFADINADYAAIASEAMVNEPLWFTNTFGDNEGFYNNYLYNEMSYIEIELEEQLVAQQ